MENGSKLPADSGMAAPILFGVGDVVTWTNTTSNGSGFNFSTRTGKIEEIGGYTAFVKMRNGRRAWVMLSRLRKEGQRTELTEAFMGKDSLPNATSEGSPPSRIENKQERNGDSLH